MSDAYLKVKDNGENGLSLERDAFLGKCIPQILPVDGYVYDDFVSPGGITFKWIDDPYSEYADYGKVLKMTGETTTNASGLILLPITSPRPSWMSWGKQYPFIFYADPQVNIRMTFKDSENNTLAAPEFAGSMESDNVNVFTCPWEAAFWQLLFVVPSNTVMGAGGGYAYPPRFLSAYTNRQLTDLQMYKGVLKNGTDLNDVFETSIYYLTAQATGQYINNAVSSGTVYLTTRREGNIVFQIAEALSGARKTRYSSNLGGTWTSWV